jgi:Cu(I)/Ag(I) efflux system membrane fusion protein
MDKYSLKTLPLLWIAGVVAALLLSGLPVGPTGWGVRGAHAAEQKLKAGMIDPKTGKKIKYWVAPMNPKYISKKPGKSPMGMDLVPVYEDEGGSPSESGAPVVRLSPAVMSNLGVRTAKVDRGTLWRRIDTVGYVDYDENRISHVHVRTEGWVERLLARAEGEPVHKGELLFELYAPTLVSAQEEYLEALKSSAPGLIRASRERLRALGVPRAQIDELSRSRQASSLVKTFAEQDGIVSHLKIREGMYVKPATEVMSLADLSSVWLMAEVFEHQADWVRTGQSAEARFPYLPGKTWKGRVQYVYPYLDAMTRTLKVRIRFDNPDGVLKPNMFANVTIDGSPKRDVLRIPAEALIRSGRSDRVVLALGDGRFQPRDVVVGIETGDWMEIRSGLKEGERVVVSAQFLIDSESSLRASFQRMSTGQDEAPAAGETKP